MSHLPGSERLHAVLRLVLPLIAIGVALPLIYLLVWRGVHAPLVVYCTHDSVFSEPVLKEFEKRTGIPVAPRFDSEATKSLGLVEQIIAEKDRPRCDVFWNNELLGTMDLQKRGLLLAYKSPNAERIPASLKDSDGYWVGFAGRLRVLMWQLPEGQALTTIGGPDRFSERDEVAWCNPDAVVKNAAKCAMAKPIYGTTFTQYCVLWEVWGGEQLKAWHRKARAAGLHEVMGNAQVKQAVSSGVCDWGFTDTDDFYAARDEGARVEMAPVRVGLPAGGRQVAGKTICIPNTVAIIRGTRREADAKKLVDFLLSEECEAALANSKSRQVPLGPVDESKLPAEVNELKKYVADAYPLAGLGNVRDECLAWLKSEYIK